MVDSQLDENLDQPLRILAALLDTHGRTITLKTNDLMHFEEPFKFTDYLYTDRGIKHSRLIFDIIAQQINIIIMFSVASQYNRPQIVCKSVVRFS